MLPSSLKQPLKSVDAIQDLTGGYSSLFQYTVPETETTRPLGRSFGKFFYLTLL